MNAKPTQKIAVPSTPAATPAASQAAMDANGADAEVTAGDILAALGQLSDDSKPAQTDDEPEARNQMPEAGMPEEVTGMADGEATANAGESEGEAAESGDDVDETPGDVNEAQAPEAVEAATRADPKEPSPTQQRINELVARAKSAEEALARSNERLATFDAELAGRTDPGVLEHIDTPEALATQRRAIVDLRQKLMRSPNGIDLTVNGQSVSYDADGVANLLAETEMLVLEAIPAREKYLATRATQEATASQIYPWLNDSAQGQGAQVANVLKQNPALRKIGPAYKLVAADALIGQTLREAGVQVTPQLIDRLKQEVARAAAAKPGTVRPAAPQMRKQPPAAPSRPGTLPARITPRAGLGNAAEKRLRTGDGNVNDLTASIAARL